MGLFTNIVRDYFHCDRIKRNLSGAEQQRTCLIACEYGPMAAGAFGVFISCLSLMCGSMLQSGF